MLTKEIVKKDNNKSTNAEYRAKATVINSSSEALGIITDYLSMEVDRLDKLLNKPEALYTTEGNPDRHVAVLLAERSVLTKLYLLLTKDVDIIDADQAEV